MWFSPRFPLQPHKKVVSSTKLKDRPPRRKKQQMVAFLPASFLKPHPNGTCSSKSKSPQCVPFAFQSSHMPKGQKNVQIKTRKHDYLSSNKHGTCGRVLGRSVPLQRNPLCAMLAGGRVLPHGFPCFPEHSPQRHGVADEVDGGLLQAEPRRLPSALFLRGCPFWHGVQWTPIGNSGVSREAGLFLF